ncbi:MAG: CocE/NonD family hydrolase [Armatimonadota bacterium]
MPRKQLFAALVCALCVGAIVGYGTARGSQAPDSRRVLRDVMVPMRDGVKLATDIYLPPGRGPFAALLARTPYDKSALAGIGTSQTRYAFVAQDVRGRYKSEGDFVPFAAEARDGYDTIEWCAKQPWCNGKIAMFGGSYVGFVQYLAAAESPPHLTCIMPIVPPADMYDTVYQGGALRQELIQGWMIGMAASSKYAKANPRPIPPEWDPPRWFWHLPLADPGPLSQGGPSYEKAWREYLSNPVRNKKWDELNLHRMYPRIKVPSLAVGGWFDIFQQQNLDTWRLLRKQGGSPEARAYHRLIIGAWTHGVGAKPGDRDFGPDAGIDLAALANRWYDRWLSGVQNGIENEAPLRTFTMGRNKWVDRREWPPSNTTPLRLYLSNTSDDIKAGVLTPAKPRSEVPTSFVYDSNDPVPTNGGNNLIAKSGIRDQRDIEKRPDVLLFTTAPLEEDLEVAGRMTVRLYVSSSARDTDFTAKLVDVLPDGTAYNVADGLIRARWRNPRRQSLIQPGRVYALDIDLWSTSMVFQKGHRIRLEVSSSNFPRFSRNPNTGRPIETETQLVKATNTVFHDAKRSSCLVLPVVRTERR